MGNKKESSNQGVQTLVSFILDKSGSMESVKTATINGFNEYIQELRKREGDYAFTLTLFDTAVENMYTNVPLSEVKKLTDETYHPNGATALYDAVCETVEKVERTMQPNQKSLVIIMTDGEENSSTKFDQAKTKHLIEHLQRTEKWSFVFLGSNQDSWKSGGAMGIYVNNTANFNSTDKGTAKAFYTAAVNTASFSMNEARTTQDFFSKDDQEQLKSTK